MNKEVFENYIKELEIRLEIIKNLKLCDLEITGWINWYEKQIKKFKKKLEEIN